ncbi:C-type lectin domain family 10 member A-like isoform X2 [Antennarius striatus]
MLDFIFISFGLLCIIQAVLNVSLRLSRSRESTSLSCNNNLSGETDLLRNQITDLQNTIRNLENKTKNLENKTKNLENEKKNLEKMLGEVRSSPSCPSGWVMIERRCYFLSNERRSWQESRRSCQADGADLVVFNSLEEVFVFLHVLSVEFWIGLSNTTGTLQWVDGSIPDPGFTPEVRDDVRGDCVRIDDFRINGYLVLPTPCGQRLRWVCEKDPR